jgi:glutaredoxin 3
MLNMDGKPDVIWGLMGNEIEAKPRITVYTADPCARCIKAKDLLRRLDLAFEEVNLTKDPVGRKELVAFTGQMTFPQIIIGHEPLGGLDDLEQAAESGRLAELAKS